jgi:iron complex outermembrane receptor protein
MKIRLLALSLLASTLAFADDIKQLAPTVVTATRVETNSFDLPVSIDVVGKENIQDAQLGMTLSESLIRVPGLTAQNRTQLAQDPQISSRGYGARSAFGVRGIRIYVDGIPLTTPDGIAQPGNVDLGTIKSIEVMRGPFSTMYGSSSGGVIQMITEDSPKDPEIKFGFLAGSYGTTKESTRFSGTANNIQYLFDFSRFDTDGYRQHSSAWKNQATGQLKFNLDNGTKATILLDYSDSKAQDPLGLARSNGTDIFKTSGTAYKATFPANNYYSAFTDPKAVPDVALLANTRVERTNTQVGLNLEHSINENNKLNLIASLGQRDNLQYLAIPVSCVNVKVTVPTCANYNYDRTKGRASSIARDFWSTEFNWVNRGEILQKKYSVVAGLNFGSMEDKRKDVNTSNGEMLDPLGYNSKYTSTVDRMDPYGNINRNEVDKAYNFDQYIQGQFSALNNLDLHAGVRHSRVNMKCIKTYY